MPKYELCYILASSVSDDQVPAVTEQIKGFIADFGGENIQEENLGKKKLAFPIKKTRNGFYVAVQFNIPTEKINQLEAKIRSQTTTVIRHLVMNIDEHLARLAKDTVAQAQLSKQPEDETGSQTVGGPARASYTREPVTPPATPRVKAEPLPELTTEELDKQIEAALSDEIIK